MGLAERIFAGPRARRLIDGVEAGLDRVDANLERELHVSDALADATSRYLFDAGGKRVRPMLALLTAHLGDGVTEDVVEAATALELTHLGSLYHDDVMDDADKRRGVPSAHSVWGNNIAILTGDLLFARASQIMARLGEGAIRLQANTFERLVLGQMHETVGPTDA
ncbi:MAG TPA: geranylgeranyl pyrophosphate synthase, partial [Microbacterium sp.]|nr:geranylgeranyl pyrophosphate synthase [Microbacterium sp.]